MQPSSREDDGDDEAVEAKSFGENEDEDHSDVNVFLGVGADTSITDNTNAETGSEGGESTAETTGQVLVALVGTVVGDDGAGDDTGGVSSVDASGAGLSDYIKDTPNGIIICS